MTESRKHKSSKDSTSLRISKELLEKINRVVKEVPGAQSANSIGVAAIEAVLKLIDTPPNKRTIPAIVLMVDSIRGPKPPFIYPNSDLPDQSGGVEGRVVRKETGGQ